MSNEYFINWKRGDYISLGKAISSFNKKINELNKEERKLYLPDTLDYNTEKQLITTRKQLNTLIKSLNKFKIKGAEEKIVLESGEEITKWEYKELKRLSGIAINRKQEQLSNINMEEHPLRIYRSK